VIAGSLLLAGSSAGTVDLWKIDAGPIPQALAPAADQAIARVTFSPNGEAALALSRDGTVRIWRVNERAVLDGAKSHQDVLRYLQKATSACLTAKERVTLLAEDASAAVHASSATARSVP
jgi:WD40 repeat protein